MKMFKYCFVLLLLLFAGQITAQDILTIVERDRDGKYRDKNNPDSIKEGYINNKIVDINSILDIQLDRTVLNSKVGELYKERMPDELSEKISKLALALKNRNRTLTQIEEVVKSYDYEKFNADTAAYKEYIDTLAKISSELVDITNIDVRIENEYFKVAGDPDKMYSGVFEAAEKVLVDLENELEQFAKESGVRIQFGGWLVTKDKNVPIHFQGFDDIAPQSPYEVERWQFIPTKDQLDEIQAIKQLSKDNVDKGLNILKETAQNQLEALQEFGKINLQQLIQDLENLEAEGKKKLGENINPELKKTIESVISLKLTIADFVKDIDQRLDYYRHISFVNSFDLIGFLDHAKADIEFITSDDSFIILTNLKTIKDQVKGLGTAVIAQKDTIAELLNDFYLKYEAKVNYLKSFAEKNIDEFIYGRELDMAALEFGNDVHKLSLNDLPDHVELDLIYTGVRTDGDRLALKMTVSDRETVQPLLLTSREIYMFKVLPHIITTVGVIFADPLANNAVQTQFQMAPAYNVIFKGLGDQGRRRKSVIYNRLFDWGVGLHISAPDFDKDDVPEIAAGVVISSLHDYLQGGFAFNLFTGDPFWFFGLRFPIPSFNMSASSPGTIE